MGAATVGVSLDTRDQAAAGKSGQRWYLPGDAFLRFVLGEIEVILALEANPEFCRGADISGKAEGQFLR